MTLRPYYLTIDSGNEDEPEPRTFASLEAALRAFEETDDQWKRFAWITGPEGTHMRDGALIEGRAAMSADLAPGDRVHSKLANLTGTVEAIRGRERNYAKVKWDHLGLAFAALGTMADLQRTSLLEKVD